MLVFFDYPTKVYLKINWWDFLSLKIAKQKFNKVFLTSAFYIVKFHMRTQTQYKLAIPIFLVSYVHTNTSDLDYSTEKLGLMLLDCYNGFIYV